MKTPIAIMSFNRPNFLVETLQSLTNQIDHSLDGREVHLFQDGAVNRWSRMRYADDASIEECIEIFKRYFPSGIVHYTGDNVGICENFCRAEEFFFDQNSFETAWFFEDDMILSPVYLKMMERMEQFARRTPRLAYFSAYGDYYASPDEVAAHRNEVIQLDHHWAFGLRREAWLKMRGALAGYYKLVRGQDYSRRYHRDIFEYFARSGLVPRGSSQDAAKTWACARLGLLRVRTFAPFARYIGTQGAHMTPEKFAELGFANTVIEQAEITDLKFPGDNAITELLDEQRNLLLTIYRTELSDIMNAQPVVRKFSPMRTATVDDVIWAYRLFLNRDPESQDVIDKHAGTTAIYTLVRGLVQSREYQKSAEGDRAAANGSSPPASPCSEEDLVRAYQMALHRDPDRPAIEQREARGLTRVAIVRELVNSTEFSEIVERIQHPW